MRGLVVSMVIASVICSAAMGAQPKSFSHFQALEPGAVRAEGWIREYTRTIADGWPLLYAKERVPMVYDQYWVRNGMTPDYSSYYADAFIRLSHIVPESALAKEMKPWLAKVLASQEADGYLGGVPAKTRWGKGSAGDEWLEVFAQSVMLQGLIYHYKRTGDQTILDACTRSANRIVRAFHQPTSEVNHDVIFSGHGAIVIRPMRDLYEITGNQAYADLAKDVLTKYGHQNQYLRRCDDPNFDSMANAHAVIETENVSFPAEVYEMTGDENLRKASVAAWEMETKYIAVDGQPTGNEGLVKPVTRALMEHCAGVDWSFTDHEMLRIIGDVRYADAAERALFNAYPGSKSPDTITYGYMHTVNQLVAAEWAYPRDFDRDDWFSRTYYTSAHLPLCCGVNSPRAMPYYIDSMALRTGDSGIAIAYYGPARIKTSVPGAGDVELTMDTKYPFEDTVRITVNPEKEASFPIELRIPGWCSSAKVTLNGTPLSIAAEPGKFATVSRSWRKGDLLVLDMQVPVKLVDYPESELNTPGAAVIRGPLTFVVPVAEDWQPFESHWFHGPAHDKKSAAYRILPKKGSIWNYALVVDKAHPDKSFTLKSFPAHADSVLWKDIPIGLEVKARKVLDWQIEGSKDRPMTPNLPYKPMKLSAKATTITLVPFGCTRLRMSYLPIVEK